MCCSKKITRAIAGITSIITFILFLIFVLKGLPTLIENKAGFIELYYTWTLLGFFILGLIITTTALMLLPCSDDEEENAAIQQH